FMLGNLFDFDPEKDLVPYEKLREVDKFMLVKLNKVIKKVLNAYENYDYPTIYHTVNNFCTVDLSAFYFDFSKDILYIEVPNHPHRRAIQSVLYETLVSLAKLISPILPHTADEVWSYIPAVKEESVQLTDMPEYVELPDADKIAEKWNGFMRIRDDVLKALEEAASSKA